MVMVCSFEAAKCTNISWAPKAMEITENVDLVAVSNEIAKRYIKLTDLFYYKLRRPSHLTDFDVNVPYKR